MDKIFSLCLKNIQRSISQSKTTTRKRLGKIFHSSSLEHTLWVLKRPHAVTRVRIRRNTGTRPKLGASIWGVRNRRKWIRNSDVPWELCDTDLVDQSFEVDG